MPARLLYVDDFRETSLSEIVLVTKGGEMEVNGIAHIFLTASNFGRSREFYRKLLPFLGMKPVIDTDEVYYCVGGRRCCVPAKSGRPAPSVLSRPRARRR